MPMDKISLAEARKIAEKKGLKPGLVKGTEGIQFTRGKNARIAPVSWEEFERALKKRKLAIYESGGFLKVMKA
jgi:hypothetical protein